MKNFLVLILLQVFFGISLFGQSDRTNLYDTISFESPTTKVIIKNDGTNIWHIGKPNKNYFDNALLGMKAIFTDTSNYYPPKDTSSFVCIFSKIWVRYTCPTCLEFTHKYDMDTIGDKGIVEASQDGGKSWYSLPDTNKGSEYYNGYMQWKNDFIYINGAVKPHKLITSGKSNGWVKSTFCWPEFHPVGINQRSYDVDTLMIRFTFISDSLIKNKEGWMIDNIIITSNIDCGGSIHENSSEEKISVSPNPFTSQTLLQTERYMKHATLSVYNSFGQIVKQIKNISGHTVTLQRDNLSGGIYFLKITEDNVTFATEKLLITDN